MPLKSSASQGSGPHGASPLSSWEIRSGLGNGNATQARKRKNKLREDFQSFPEISLGPPHNRLTTGREEGMGWNAQENKLAIKGIWGRTSNHAPRQGQGDSHCPQEETAVSPWPKGRDPLRKNIGIDSHEGRTHISRTLAAWRNLVHQEAASPSGPRNSPFPGCREVWFQNQRESRISSASISRDWQLQN